MPTVNFVENLLKQEMSQPPPEVIVGVGGGSVIDTAKCLSTLLVQKNSFKEILNHQATMTPNSIPCFAIPTTAGTGSEVTSSATVWDMDNHRKRSLAGEWMYPKCAIVDPELTMTMPPRITAITGLDAMAHAIEAAYSIRSTPRSDAHAFQSLRTIFEELENAVSNGGNKEAREALLHGSLEAGLAIAETSTAAAHSVSYPLTIHYGVAHGHAVGLLAPEFLAYNMNVSESDCQDRRGIPFVIERCKLIASTIGCKDVLEARRRFRLLIAKVGLETNLRDLGVKDIGLVAKEGLDPDRVSNQPRTVTEQAVQLILEEIYS